MDMPTPDPERIGITHGPGSADEWWVTVDGNCVVGFGGPDAQARAERYASDLLKIGQRDADLKPSEPKGEAR
jgi:hypothetical protein